MVFRKFNIEISVPDNTAGLKCAEVFFEAVAAVLNCMTDSSGKNTARVLVHETVAMTSRTAVRVSETGAIEIVAQSTNRFASTFEAVGSAGSKAVASTTARTAAKVLAVGGSLIFAAWDGYNIYSTWTTDSETVKKIEEILEDLE